MLPVKLLYAVSFCAFLVAMPVKAKADSTAHDRIAVERVQSDEETFKIHMMSARRGDTESQYHVATMMMEGRGTEKNEKRAAEWMMQAAGERYPQALLALGRFYTEGRGVKADPAEAYIWSFLAAEALEDDAQRQEAVELRIRAAAMLPEEKLKTVKAWAQSLLPEEEPKTAE